MQVYRGSSRNPGYGDFVAIAGGTYPGGRMYTDIDRRPCWCTGHTPQVSGHEHFAAIGHRWGIATSLCRIGLTEMALEHYELAREQSFTGFDYAIEYQYNATVIYAMIGLGILWSITGDDQGAVEILSFVQNHPSTPALYKDIAQPVLAELEKRLSTADFSAPRETPSLWFSNAPRMRLLPQQKCNTPWLAIPGPMAKVCACGLISWFSSPAARCRWHFVQA